nr:putative lipid II flippase FtsW [Streptomyces cacaoi]
MARKKSLVRRAGRPGVRELWRRPGTPYLVLVGSCTLLTVFGLMMVFSASQVQALSHGHGSAFYFRKQLLAAAAGAVLLVAAMRAPVRLHRKAVYPVLGTAVVLLCLVQVPGLGQTVNGSTNWLSLGGSFQLQPSEFAKVALVLWGADLIARKESHRLLTSVRHLLLPLVPGALLLLGLVLIGGDMGTALILCCVLFSLLWTAGTPARVFGWALAAAALACVALVATTAYRAARLSCVGAVDPGPDDQCWQAVHGLYAFADGGLFGRGLGASMEKWGQLPEPHTDFVLAITGEETGLVGTLTVLALYALLLAAGLAVAARTGDTFVRLTAVGVTTWIAAQSTINIGGALGLLPISGVPLPLFSYGGSALIAALFGAGLLLSLARSQGTTVTAPRRGKRSGRGGKSPGDGGRRTGGERTAR